MSKDKIIEAEEVKSAKFGVNVTENTDVLSLQRGLADGESVRINKSIKND